MQKSLEPLSLNERADLAKGRGRSSGSQDQPAKGEAASDSLPSGGKGSRKKGGWKAKDQGPLQRPKQQGWSQKDWDNLNLKEGRGKRGWWCREAVEELLYWHLDLFVERHQDVFALPVRGIFGTLLCKLPVPDP